MTFHASDAHVSQLTVEIAALVVQDMTSRCVARAELSTVVCVTLSLQMVSHGHLGPHARVVRATLYVHDTHGSVVLALRQVELLEWAGQLRLLVDADSVRLQSRLLGLLLDVVSPLDDILTCGRHSAQDLLLVLLTIAVSLTTSLPQLEVLLHFSLQLEYFVEDPVAFVSLLLLAEQRRRRSMLQLLVDTLAFVLYKLGVDGGADGLVHPGRRHLS